MKETNIEMIITTHVTNEAPRTEQLHRRDESNYVPKGVTVNS